jgi:hypothetical protein
MALMLPGEVEWVLELLGHEWPDANEDEIHRAATAWRDFAATASQLGTRGVEAASAVRSTNSGEAVEAFEKRWREFESGGNGYLNDAVDAANAIALALDTVALAVLASKVAVIAQLVALAFEIAAAQAAAPLTSGLSELGAVGATQITRVVVRRLLDELKQVIVETIADTLRETSLRALRDMGREVLTSAAKEGATAMGQDLIEQSVRVNFGAQNGFDVKGAAGKGLGTFEESATAGLKDGLTGVKDNIVGLADPGTYVDAATERATRRAEEAANQGLNRAAGRGQTADEGGGTGDSGAAADAEPAATTGSGTPDTPDTPDTLRTASAAPAPTTASGRSSAGQSSSADRIRADFG